MLRVLLVFFLAGSVQASSLRTCVIEKSVTGSNCHERWQTAWDVASGSTDHTDCPSEENRCTCNMERFVVAAAASHAPLDFCPGESSSLCTLGHLPAFNDSVPLVIETCLGHSPPLAWPLLN